MRLSILALFCSLSACGSTFDVAEPLEEDAPGDSCAPDLVRNECPDAAGEVLGVDSRVDDGLADSEDVRDAATDTFVPVVDSSEVGAKDSGDSGGSGDSGSDTAKDAVTTDTAKPDTHCPNPDDWTNCGLCCYPAICVGGAGGTCG